MYWLYRTQRTARPGQEVEKCDGVLLTQGGLFRDSLLVKKPRNPRSGNTLGGWRENLNPERKNSENKG